MSSFIAAWGQLSQFTGMTGLFMLYENATGSSPLVRESIHLLLTQNEAGEGVCVFLGRCWGLEHTHTHSVPARGRTNMFLLNLD